MAAVDHVTALETPRLATAAPFRQLRSDFASAMAAGSSEPIRQIVTHLNQRAAAAIVGHDVAEIVRLRSQSRRIARSADHLPSIDPTVQLQAESWFESLDTSLQAGRLAVLGRIAAERDAQATGALRDRIVARLTVEASRPRDLAKMLEVDQTQVSRALRQLIADGHVERVQAPAGDSDARAHWYAVSAA